MAKNSILPFLKWCLLLGIDCNEMASALSELSHVSLKFHYLRKLRDTDCIGIVSPLNEFSNVSLNFLYSINTLGIDCNVMVSSLNEFSSGFLNYHHMKKLWVTEYKGMHFS